MIVGKHRKAPPRHRCMSWALSVGLLVLLILPPRLTSADTLKEVQQSAAMRAVLKSTRKDKAAKDGETHFLTGMDKGSNFASIWQSNKSPALLLGWISANIPKYSTGVSYSRRSEEFVEARVAISNTTKSSVVLTIMVPHPTYRPMVEHRTMAEFNRYEPPALPVAYEETLPLGEVEGKLYQTTRNECSILVKTAQMSIVNLSVRDCRDKHLLVSVAKALDFPRLNKKLNS